MTKIKLLSNRLLLFAVVAGLLLLTGCRSEPGLVETAVVSPRVSQTAVEFTITPSLAASDTLTPAPSQTHTRTPGVTPEPTGTPTLTPTAIPTYVTLRGKVLVDQAVCHYGPGAPYLYKYAVIKDSNLEIIARDEPGIYVQIQAIGGNNPCWVKAEYMQINGSLADLQPIHADDAHLPMSPYYFAPPAQVSAIREGDTVTVFWSPVILKAGDDSEQVPYLIEAWVCRDGELVFTPLGAWETALKITDEAGCSEPSHGRLYAVEKHGYTRWVKIPWPPAE